jgi:hypothetical protein
MIVKPHAGNLFSSLNRHAWLTKIRASTTAMHSTFFDGSLILRLRYVLENARRASLINPLNNFASSPPNAASQLDFFRELIAFL